jgi:tetratricopeptide (TPR) repeat protein
MLAECFSSLAMVDKAARETGLAVKLLQSALDPADRSLLQAELRHVRALLDVQRPRKAKVLVETLIPMVHNVFEPGHPVVLEAETMAANVHLKLGNIEQAQLELRELRERAAEIGANDDIQFDILRSLVIALRSGLGVEPRNSPLIEETASLAREATERSTRLWGPNDLRSLQARLFLADLLCKQGEFHDSAATCEEILGTSENDLGKQHSLRLKAMDVLAMDRHRLGNSSEAADLQLQVIEGARSNSENPIQLIADISDSLPILDRGNRWAEGEALATEYKVELEKLGGGHGDFMFNARLYIARFCSLQRRIEQAEDQFQALFAQAELHTPEAPVLARLHLFYADHLRQRECFEQAEHHLQIAAASVDDIRLGTNVTNPDDIISAFIALYEAWGKPDPMTEYQNLLRQVQGYTAGDKPVISND